MRRLLPILCLAGAFGCQCGRPDGALKVVVKLDPAQRASCAVVEVVDGAAVVASQELPRQGRDELVVGVKQGDLPASVSLRARAFISAAGCDAPRNFNGVSAEVQATFPESGVQTVELQLGLPAADVDVDRDGYVAIGFGGLDCGDNDSSIRPGATQLCTSSTDQDCDGQAGCADSECAPQAVCQRTPDRLAFVTPPRTVDARACSPALTLEAQDAAGSVAAQQGLPVALSASPATGVTFYADANCTTAVASVTIAQGQSQVSFHFRSTEGGTTFTAEGAVLGLTPATQLETVTHPAPTQLAFTTPPRTQAANACSAAMTVELRDAGGTATQSAGAVLVTMAGAPSVGLQFFADAACTSQLSGNGFTIPAGQTTGTFYARGTRAGGIGLTASATSLSPGTQTMTVTPLAATQLRFVTGPQGIATATCSGVVTVEAQDVYGNASPVGAATAVTLSANPSAGFGFFSDAACGTAAAQVSIPSGQAQASFYFRGTAAGSVVMTAASSLGNDTQTAGIGVGPPVKLTITSAAQTAVVAGNCSAPVTVQSRDVSNNPSNITGSALAVTLTGNPATPIQFFSDASCSAAIAQSSIPVGSTTATFYFRSTLAGVVNVAVSSSLPTGDNQNETVVATTPTVIAFTNTPFTVAANTCAGPFTLQSRDQYGNASPVSSNTAVGLTSLPPGVTFFTAANCSAGSATATLNLAASSSSVSFYARATAAAAYALTAAAGGLGNDTQTFTVTPGPVDRLAFVPPTSNLVAGACSAAIAVQRQDQFGNPVTGGPLTVNLTEDTTSTAFEFHLAAGCGDAAVTSAQIPNLGSSVTVYVTAQRAEVVNLTAQAASISNDGAHAVTVTPAALNRLVFIPLAGSVVAGVCTPQVTVQRQDQYQNPITTGPLTVNLGHSASGGTFGFHDTAGCGAAAVTSVAIADGSSTAALYMRATRAEVVPVSATAAGVSQNGAFTLTVTPAAANTLTFSPAAQAMTAGACATVTVDRRDGFGNLSGGGALTINLTEDTTSTAFEFHLAAGCGDAAVTSMNLPNLATSGVLFMRATRAEVVNVSATATGITTVNGHTLTVNPAAASQLVFTTAAVTTGVGVCSGAVTVQRQDQFGNPVAVGANTPVALSDDGTNVNFHLAAGCGDAAVTSATILGGQSSTTFYIVSDTQQTGVTLTATEGVLVGTQLANITSPPRLFFTTTAQAITGGQCSQVITIERQTAAGAPITSGGPLVVSLSSNATSNAVGGLTFHLAAGCGDAPVTQATIPGGNSSVDVYVKAHVAENPLLTAQATGFANGTQTLTVTAGPAFRLVFTSVAQNLVELACSAQVTVQLQDAGGNAVNAGGAGRTIALSGTGGTVTTFYATANDCSTSTNPLVSRNMGAGASTVTFFFKAENGPTTTLTASTASVTDGTQVTNLTDAPATRLVFTTSPPTVEAGFCQALVLERRDDASRPVTSATPAIISSLTASPAPVAPLLPVQFFSDAACTVTLSVPFNIPASSANTTVYVKGRSGAVSGANTTSQVYGVTAQSAGLSDGTVNVTVLPMVRRGSCTLGNTSITCAVTPTLTDISRTMLVYQVSATTDDAPGDDNVTCHLQLNTGVAEVLCERATDGANFTVNWQTVSFPYAAGTAGGATVQHLSATCDAQPKNVSITNAGRGSSFLLFSSRGTGGITGNNGDDFYMAEMTSNTNVQILQAPGLATCSVAANYRFQVVTWNGANVDRGVLAGGAGGLVATPFTASVTSSVLSRSLLLHTHRMSAYNSGSNAICRFRLTGTMTSATQASFTRGCTGEDVGNISWERVELPTNASVQSFNMTSAALTQAVTEVDRTRAFLMLSGNGPGGTSGGRTDYASGDRIGTSQATPSFAAANSVTLARGNGGGTAAWSLYVVEVTP